MKVGLLQLKSFISQVFINIFLIKLFHFRNTIKTTLINILKWRVFSKLATNSSVKKGIKSWSGCLPFIRVALTQKATLVHLLETSLPLNFPLLGTLSQSSRLGEKETRFIDSLFFACRENGDWYPFCFNSPLWLAYFGALFCSTSFCFGARLTVMRNWNEEVAW